MKPTTRIIDMLIECSEELGLSEFQVNLLRAADISKTDAQLNRMTGKTTAVLELKALCRSIKGHVRRTSKAVQEGKHPILWTGLPRTVANRIKSMNYDSAIVYWEDVVDQAHRLPSITNLGPKTYNEIKSLALSIAGLEMPTWDEVCIKTKY